MVAVKGKTGTWKRTPEQKKKLREHIVKAGERTRFKKGHLKTSGAFKGGENHWNWKGGKSNLITRIRVSYKYRQWVSDVFTRDNFTCQDCEKRGRLNLHAHHIENIAKIIDKYKIKTLEQAIRCNELWNINNGTTLCENCHRKTDTYGLKNNCWRRMNLDKYF